MRTQPKGVYGIKNGKRPWQGGRVYGDIWKIDCSGMPREEDRQIWNGWVILDNVPPERLTLVYKAGAILDYDFE